MFEIPPSEETVMSNVDKIAVTYGIDLGKSWFHLVGLDAAGAPVKKAKLNRSGIVAFFVNVPAARIGMEACPGSQWLARNVACESHHGLAATAAHLREAEYICAS